MKKGLKKALVMLLSLTMVFTFMAIPTTVAFADDEVSAVVTFTMSNKGLLASAKDGTAVAEKPVTVTDLDEDGHLTYDEALVAAHNAYFEGGAEAGYALGSGQYGAFVSKLWGVDVSNTLFYTNGAGIPTGVTADTVEEGDSLYVSINADDAYYADWFTKFSEKNIEATDADDITVTLTGHLGMAFTEEDMKFVPLEGVQIGVWKDGAFEAIEGAATDADGKATFKLAAGEYILTAKGTVKDEITPWGASEAVTVDCPIMAPYAKLTVTESAEPTAPAVVTFTMSNKGLLASAKDGTAVAEKPVTVTDLDEDGHLTYDEALVAAHNAYFEGGAEAGYALGSGQYGAFVSKLWGVDVSNTLFYTNGAGIPTGVTADTVEEGDSLYVSINADDAYYADWFTKFSEKDIEATDADDITVTLTGHLGMAFTEEDMKFVPLEGVQIGVWKDGAFEAIEGAVTGADGKATFKLAAGEYILTAKGTVKDEITPWGASEAETVDCPIMAPYAKLTVTQGPEPEKIELDITNTTTMFKADSAYLTKEGDREYLVVELSGTGYKELFKGTYEAAVTNGDGTADKGNDTWIHSYTNDEGKYEFKIPVTADDTFIPLVAISNTYYTKYLNGQNSLARAFFPRQLILDREAETLVTGDYEYTQTLSVDNKVSMFSVAGADLYTVGGPNSNNYKAELILKMGSTSFDKAYVGKGSEITEETTTIPANEGNAFVMPVKWVETFGQPETMKSLVGKPFIASFHSVRKNEWYDRKFVINEENGTLVIEEAVVTIDDLDGMTEEEAIAYVTENASVELLNTLIEAIQVQYRDENTDVYCAAAKACWDALDAEGKLEDDGYFSDDTGDASLDDPLNTAPNKEKELLVVSFGTSFNDSRVATIGAVEKALAAAYGNEYAVRRAFTAQIIINHIQSRDGEYIDNVAQAMDKAVEADVKEMIVQPTHLMSGAEYDELKEEIDKYADKIKISYAKPLLNSDADKQAVAKAVVEAALKVPGYASIEAAAADGVAFVFMGHGTSHEANVTYTQMQQTMDDLGYDNCFVGTVEGNPPATALPEVKKAVEAKGYTKVILRPLMVVAGDHANNDMAADEEGSWYYAFVNGGEFEVEGQDEPVDIGEGFGSDNVTCQINGLGEIEAVQQIYVAHTKSAIPNTPGWHKIGGDWYYYDKDGLMVTDKWEKDSKGWCYLGTDGKMVTNDWAKDSKGYCWIGSNGYMVEKTQWLKIDGDWYHITKGYRDQSKWMKDSKGWCYLAADGKMVTNDWAKDSKGYCWIGSEGYMIEKTQWLKVDGTWYHITNGYRDQSKWMKDSKGWCYLAADGKMVTNDWAKDSKGYCWIGPDGYMVEKTQWFQIGEDWYHITKGYRDQNKWMKDSKGWCYVGADGKMVTDAFAKDSKGYCWIGPEGYMLEETGLIKFEGDTYYIKDGYMQTGCTVEIDGVTYTFGEDGKLLPTTTIEYTGDDVKFVQDDLTSTFGMLTPRDDPAPIFKLNEDGTKVQFKFTPSNLTVYAGFYLEADINVPSGWNKDKFVAAEDDGTYDFELDASYCGKAVPIAPVKKKDMSATTGAQYYLAIPPAEKLESRIPDGVYALPELSAGPSSMFNHFIPDSKMLIVDGNNATVRFITDGSTASIQKYSKIAIGKSSELVTEDYQAELPEGTTIAEGKLQPYDAGTGVDKYLFEVPITRKEAEAILENDIAEDIYIVIWNKVGSSTDKIPGWYKASNDIYLSLGTLGEETQLPAEKEAFRFTLQVGQYTEGEDFHTASFEGVEYALKDAAGNLYAPSYTSTGSITYSNLSVDNTYTFTATKEGWTVAKQGEWNTEAHAYEYIPMETDEINVTITSADADKNITDHTNPGMVFIKKAAQKNVVDEALEAVPEGLNYEIFTDASGKALKDAIAAADPNATDEAQLDAMAEAIYSALEGLVPQDGEYEVTITKYNGTPYYLYEGLGDSDKGMGKAVLVVENGVMSANLVLKNNSYGHVYLGTKEAATEAAVTAGDIPNDALEISMPEEKITINGKEYTYSTVTVPVPNFQKQINYSYHSKSKTYDQGWYDHAVMYLADSLVPIE